VLEDWCPPFAGFFLYYPSRRQQPAALSALIETWIDTKVPALGNRTPRQAAKTVRGRERRQILADFARTAERSPSATRPDVEALRRTLGLD
jgi:hypothetical protein